MLCYVLYYTVVFTRQNNKTGKRNDSRPASWLAPRGRRASTPGTASRPRTWRARETCYDLYEDMRNGLGWLRLGWLKIP